MDEFELGWRQCSDHLGTDSARRLASVKNIANRCFDQLLGEEIALLEAVDIEFVF